MDSAEAQKFRENQLNEINKYRKLHGADPLVLDGEITRHAQKWADHLASIGRLSHQQNDKYGENIAAGCPASSLNPAKMWYSEVNRADFHDLEGTMNCLHFTQLVWKGSKKIGIGVTVASNGMCYVVADFDPAGNVMGYFSSNVSPPKN